METLAARRVLAAITGVVFEDTNSSLRQEVSEPGLSDRLVYLDSNQSGNFDAADVFALTDATGRFEFPQLSAGDYILRLHGVGDGSTDGPSWSQELSVPFESQPTGRQFPLIGLANTVSNAGRTISIDGDEIFVADWNNGVTATTTLQTSLGKVQSLPSDRLLAMGSEDDATKLWIVDADADDWTELAIPADGGGTPSVSATPPSWIDVAIDGDGKGLAIGSVADGLSPQLLVYSIDASDPDEATIAATEISVRDNAAIVSSSTGPRTVLASPSQGGLSLELWSNETASRISTTTNEVAGVDSLLDFDDAAGLLLLRQADGGVTVVDVNNQFAPLFEFDDLTGPVHLDAARDLLWAASPAGDLIEVLDLGSGDLIAEIAVESGSLGAVNEIVPAIVDVETGLASVALVSAGGIREVAVDRPSKYQLTLGDDQTSEVQFGVRLIGTNQAPIYQTLPQLATNEDQSFSRPAPAVLQGATDADGDPVLVLQTGPANNGFSIISPMGSVFYQPDDDFNGTDTIPVSLHDGRSITSVNLTVTVAAVPDDATNFFVNVSPVPENTLAGTVLGTISVIDVDNDGRHEIVSSDARFGVVADEIVFVGGQLDFESETLIPLVLTLTDLDTSATIEKPVSLIVTDADDPITGITPELAFPFENAFGDVIAELVVLDQDAEQFHTLTVDDDRFVVDEGQLRLIDTEALDFEAESVVIVNVTAESDTGDSFTQEIRLEVRNLPEQPASMSLVGDQLQEYERGATVGVMHIDGVANPNGYTFLVSDSRFEVVDGTLKLADDAFLIRDENDPTVQLEITAQNENSNVNEISEVFTLTVLINDHPFHNHEIPQDVNHSGDVSAQDALLIINFLNTHGPGPIGAGDPSVCYDVNGDGLITALDALLVLNFLNRNDMPPSAEGEPEMNAGDGVLGPELPVEPGPTSVPVAPAQVAPQRNFANVGQQDDEQVVQVEGPQLPVKQLKKLAALPIQSGIGSHETIVDWVLRQRGTDAETESQIDKFLSTLSDEDESQKLL